MFYSRDHESFVREVFSQMIEAANSMACQVGGLGHFSSCREYRSKQIWLLLGGHMTLLGPCYAHRVNFTRHMISGNFSNSLGISAAIFSGYHPVCG